MGTSLTYIVTKELNGNVVQFILSVDGSLTVVVPAAPNKTANATAVVLLPNMHDTYLPQMISDTTVPLVPPALNNTYDLSALQLPAPQLPAP